MKNVLAPTYTTGPKSLAKLGEIVGKYHARKPLLVTGNASYQACGAADKVSEIFPEGSVVRFSDFSVNPKIEDAIRGTKLAQAEGVDLIVAIGGGSVIDMAKLIKAFLTAPDQADALARGTVDMDVPGVPLVAAPTTAGSGSEATHFAVVYIGSDKFSLASQHLLPQDVVLDGQLLRSSTRYQRACNGLDALAQAIESAWAVGSTKQSRAFAFEAIETLLRQLPRMCASGADEKTYTDMLLAANLAGRAISISKTTAAHAWSYGLTAHHSIPHGHAVWLTLPEIVGLHAIAADSGKEVSDPRGAGHFASIMARILSLLGVDDPRNAAPVLRDFMAGVGAEPMMENLGADSTEQRRFLSQQVNMQRMSNNPVALSEAQIAKVFRL